MAVAGGTDTSTTVSSHHKTLIGGASYDIIGGTTLINGTSHSIVGGKTLIGGSSLTISFGEREIFDWGSDDGEADAAWFSRLKSYLVNNPGSASWVGRTKYVTLRPPEGVDPSTWQGVLGTIRHKIICIGVNQDAENTVTFMTLNTLANPISFSNYNVFDGSGLTTSTAEACRTYNYRNYNAVCDLYGDTACSLYYNAFPGKSSIRPVRKGTFAESAHDVSNVGYVYYQDYYVWLPSEGELGWLKALARLPYKQWTHTYNECTYGKLFSYTLFNDVNNQSKDHGYWSRSINNNANATSTYDKHTTLVSFSGTNVVRTLFYYTNYVAPCFVIGNLPSDYILVRDLQTKNSPWSVVEPV